MKQPKPKSSSLPKKTVKTAGLRLDKAVPLSEARPPGGYPSALRQYLGFCLYKSAIRLRALLDNTFLDAGLITPQFGIMSILVANGSLSQVDISQTMSIDKATMVKLIDSLEGLGYVRRAPHGQDRRIRLVELTPAGETMFKKLVEKAAQAERTFTKNLSDSERETLRQLTSKLLD